jgi:hypothetical protein
MIAASIRRLTDRADRRRGLGRDLPGVQHGARAHALLPVNPSGAKSAHPGFAVMPEIERAEAVCLSICSLMS